jgi:hypothetical protein
MCTWGDLLVVCGTSGRSINPYDQSGTAPLQYFPDPLVKVFDLRMMRQTPPLSFSPAMVAPSLLGTYGSGPSLRLISKSSSSAAGADVATLLLLVRAAMLPGRERVLVGSATGMFLSTDPYRLTPDTEFFQVARTQSSPAHACRTAGPLPPEPAWTHTQHSTD